MARLIIGHVTATSAMIWVRGDQRYPVAFLHITPTNIVVSKSLEERHGYTHAFEVKGLKPDTQYECRVEFATHMRAATVQRVEFGHCSGTFHTAPNEDVDAPFCMLLGSCNLHSLGIFSSPDRAFEELLSKVNDNDLMFMIHCGDQIYYDIPNPLKLPDINEYRAKYVDAWGESRPTRKFLTRLPHYMIMDDHEITDNFANDKPWHTSPELYRDISMKVYREFVHIRQPNSYGRQALYYRFSYGSTQFFVLDCRTERYEHSVTNKRMISNNQMSQFKKWLLKHKDQLKFVVSSVPFVGELTTKIDTWCAPAFSAQREEIIDYIVKNGIERLTFLTGDMHNSYHATMHVDGHVVIHELMSSPINQLDKASKDDYVWNVVKVTPSGYSYKSKISKFYNAHSNAMLIRVDGGKVSYEIFRTKKTRKEKTGTFKP